ncbi:lysine biosynthesis protein LysW [Candidatus Bathyarchaeota archaeon]|nr:MAG: lysine biosynthesis protein LysW [Candidatus Bathyarchaeota archaeon]
MKVTCPECGAEFEVPNDVIVGEVVTCPECGLELEVTKIESGNVEVKPVQVTGEDWGE